MSFGLVNNGLLTPVPNGKIFSLVNSCEKKNSTLQQQYAVSCNSQAPLMHIFLKSCSSCMELGSILESWSGLKIKASDRCNMSMGSQLSRHDSQRRRTSDKHQIVS